VGRCRIRHHVIGRVAMKRLVYWQRWGKTVLRARERAG
jgi:hypothetical protein